MGQMDLSKKETNRFEHRTPFQKLRIFVGRYYWALKTNLAQKEGGFYKQVIKFRGKKIVMYHRNYQQMCHITRLIFGKEEQKWLNVEGKTVYDIGGYLGESSIYFALKGAKEVFCFEPYPYAYQSAYKNTLPYKNIVLKNAAVGGSNSTIKLDNNYESYGGSILLHTGKIRVPVLSLRSIIKEKRNAVVKIDCEGGEYEIIRHAPISTLRRCKQILVEYHYGEQFIPKMLEEAGFSVKTEHTFCSVNESGKPTDHGNIYAWRN